eukprot:1069350-Amphidinium_carterae.1
MFATCATATNLKVSVMCTTSPTSWSVKLKRFLHNYQKDANKMKPQVGVGVGFPLAQRTLQS